MANHIPFCEEHMAYHCHKCAPRPLLDNLSNRLRILLDHFEPSSDKHMRTFVNPEKTPNSSIETTPLKVVNDQEIVVKQIDAEPKAKLPIATSTALTTVSPQMVSNTNNDVVRLMGGQHRSLKKHHFSGVETVSFASCSTPSKRYSEIALVIWLKREPYPSGYLGDHHRMIISLMYDAQDDIWSVSSKWLKRGNYYKTDDEDVSKTITNRLCATVDLRHEIKKMLLWIGISPREVYKIFRKTMSQDLHITDSEYGFTTVENTVHRFMMKYLNETGTHESYRPMPSSSDYHSRNRTPYDMRDPEKLRRAMEDCDGFCGY